MTSPYRIDVSRDELAEALFASPEHPLLDLHGGVAPGGPAWVIRIRAGRRVITPMVWGFPPPPGREQLMPSARNLTSTFWRPWLKPASRCLIPFTSYSGPSGLGALRPATTRIGAFAGLWRSYEEAPFFARVTVSDDGATSPMVLTCADAMRAWLEAPAAEAMDMQQPPRPDQLTPLRR